MADLNMRAKEIFNIMCRAFDNIGLKYKKDEEELTFDISFSGDDLPMNFIFIINEKNQHVSLYSRLDTVFPSDKIVEAAIATCVANSLVDGHFDLDLNEGTITFRNTVLYKGDSEIGEELFIEMIKLALAVVDKYNDLFLLLKNGTIDISGFINSLEGK